MNRDVWKPAFGAPILQTLRFAVDGDHEVAAAIAALLCDRGPPAVVGLIIPVVVWVAVDAHPFGARDSSLTATA